MATPRPADVDRLRVDIDRGRTGDKVNNPDPAAAPLGADDEAAGTPVTRERLDTAARQPLPDQQGEPPAASQRRHNGLPTTMALFFVAIAVIAVAMFLVSRGGGP